MYKINETETVFKTLSIKTLLNNLFMGKNRWSGGLNVSRVAVADHLYLSAAVTGLVVIQTSDETANPKKNALMFTRAFNGCADLLQDRYEEWKKQTDPVKRSKTETVSNTLNQENLHHEFPR